MIEVEHGMVIARPVGEVFAFLHDPANDPKWQRGTVESRQTSEGPLGVGTTVRQAARFLGRRWVSTYEITEYEPPRKSSLRGLAGPLAYAGGFLLEPAGDGTTLTMAGEMSVGGVLRLVEPLVAWFARREMEASAVRLTELLDSPAP